jgi:hypothetical protein
MAEEYQVSHTVIHHHACAVWETELSSELLIKGLGKRKDPGKAGVFLTIHI